jgi:hypothetical protein
MSVEFFEPLEGRELLSSTVALSAHQIHLAHLSAVARTPQAIVLTNKLDYRPGERAAITGSGFLPREYVRLQVLHIDGTPNTAPSHQPWTVRADARGSFQTSYLVGADDLGTTMRLTATGQTSRRSVQEIFIDATSTLRPDHVVVVIEEDRFCAAIGDVTHMPYVNQLAASGLVYTNSHGVAHPGLPDYLALYSGSTQGITDNGNNHTFTGPNIAKSLNSTLLPSGQYLSFGGYAETLPHDGDTTTRIASDPNDPTSPPDLYMRNYNPMAQFTDVGSRGGVAIANAQVNKTFASFPIDATGFANLPTVSFVIPNVLHSTHGSNEQPPYATDPSAYNLLRTNADTWLKAKLDGYLQWSKTHNSLLIVTTDEEETDTHPTSGITTIVNGDPDLFVAGTNNNFVNHFNVLRTIEDMYGVAPLGNTATATPLTTNALGQLSFPGQVVNRTDSSTVLSSNVSSTIYGQAVTFTATVSATIAGSGAPTGTVTFMDGTTALGSATLNASGQAIFSTAALGFGSHTVTAVYAGDSAFNSSSSASVSQQVAQASSTTVVTSSATPSVFGQTVTFTATVAAVAPGSGTATGSVVFSDGTTVLGTATVNAQGKATLTTATLGLGAHSITAAYSGDNNFIASTSAAFAHQVNQAASKTTLVSSANPAALGQAVTFTATVTAAAPGSGTPTGSVQFIIDGVNFGNPVPLVNGSATSDSINTLASGTHTISATYAGDVNFTAAPVANLTQSIGPVSVPAAPTGVAASDSTFSDKIRVTWNASAGATAYEVWRATTNNTSKATKISASDVLTTTYDDTSAAANTTYYYWVKAKNSSGTSGFSAADAGKRAIGAPANDNFVNAQVITGSSATASGSNVGATKEAGEPEHAGNAGGKSVWYTWTAPTSGKVTIDTGGSSFDTLLAVYTGTSVSTLTAVPGGANDDNPSGGTLTSKVSFNVIAGATYQIAVDGYGGVSGSITLHLSLV